MNMSLVLAEWKRATQSLGAALSCQRHGFYGDAVSRAYYAIFHAAKAILQVHGVSAGSHAGVKRLFGLHVVQAGLVEREWATYLGESSEARLTADYDVETELSKEDADEETERAKAFLIRIRKLLLANGLSADELRSDELDT